MDQRSLFDPEPEPAPPPAGQMTRGAQFSDDGRYRYELTRRWDPALKQIGFLMLNPSVAGAEIDDPTILRCTAFTMAWGFGGYVVRNLFALCATDPRELRKHPEPVGRFNDLYLRRCSAQDITVAAWGTNGDLHGRDVEVAALLRDYGADLYHIGLTKDGFPKHPMARGKWRVPDDIQPTRWEGPVR